MKRPTTTFLAVISALTLISTPAFAQGESPEPTPRRLFVGTSMFTLVNLLPLDDPPSFYQVNVGYHVTPKDVISVEAITWTYHAPLGIPFGPDFGSEDEAYPGSVREYGVGVAYQRFLWKDFYAAAHALPLVQEYRDTEGERIQKGFQLFLTARAGYRVRLFKDRYFLEPSVAVTHWPINTNVPESFAGLEDRWPNYFLFEPGLHFGVRF